MTNNNVLTWKIGGRAGDGQQVAGLIFSKIFSRSGYNIFDTTEFPSLIRGGHVTYQVSFSAEPIETRYRRVDVLLALNQETIDLHLDELADNAIIIFDNNLVTSVPKKKSWQLVSLPIVELSKGIDGAKLLNNMIGLGSSLAVLSQDLDLAKEVVANVFADKGQEIIEKDQKALEAGYNFIKKQNKFSLSLDSIRKSKIPSIIVNANEAVALSAIASGCKLHVHYPMSPSSSILHNLTAWADESGMVVKQPEDETSAINTAIGSSYAGVRTMTATSGGGFALMTEGFSLAGMTETPLVVVVSQRPGPATGLPSWTEQGDLNFIINAAHGEFPRIVLAPGDQQETYQLVSQAFNLADIYQLPVVVMIDKYLSESHKSISAFKPVKIDRGSLLTESQLKNIKDYKRYKITKNGVSPRAIPGFKNGVFLSNSDEHDEKGFSIEGWQSEIRSAMVEKRFKKLEYILRDKNYSQPKLYGPANAKTTLVGWGSVKGPVLEALKNLKNINFLHFTTVWPLDGLKIKKLLAKSKKIIAIENNYQGQFTNILFNQTGIKIEKRLNKYSGRQFFPEEIIDKLKKV